MHGSRGPLTSQDLTAAGLYSVKVRNPLLPQEIAAANIAVEPTNVPPAIPAVLSVGQNPMSVAVDTATGVALVANHDSNSLTVIQLTGNPTAPAQLGPTVAVGTAPTSVAIDNLRNLAVVTNNGSNNVSIVDLSVSPPVVKTTLTTAVSGSGTFLGLLPYAVGVNPLTGKALVVYQNSTQATIIDLDKRAVSATSQITLTGSNPQVAIDPRLNWGIVTPGGNGELTRLGEPLRWQCFHAVSRQDSTGSNTSQNWSKRMLSMWCESGSHLHTLLDRGMMSGSLSSSITAND